MAWCRTRIVGRNGGTAGVADLHAGDMLQVAGTVAGGRLTAAEIRDLSLPGSSSLGLHIAPTSGVAGSRVRITGSGFHVHETVAIAIDNRTLQSAVASAAGRVNFVLTLPKNLPAGRLTVVATGAVSHRRAVTTLLGARR